MSDEEVPFPEWLPKVTASIFSAIASQFSERVGIGELNDGNAIGLIAVMSERPLAVVESDRPDFILVTDPTDIDEGLPYVAHRQEASDEGGAAFWVANVAALTSQQIGTHFFDRLVKYVTGYLSFEDELASGQVDKMLDDIQGNDGGVGAGRRRVQSHEPVRVGPFEVLFETRDSISWIGAYNKRPIIYQLTARSVDGVAYENVVIDIALTSVGQPLAAPWSREVGKLGPKDIVWNTRAFDDFRLDANVLSQIAERQHAEFTLTIKRGDEILGSFQRDIDLLAPDAWVAGRPLDGYAIDLAGLVQPHEPALRPILEKAAAILQQKTGQNGLSGYQTAANGNYDYVDKMVQSIWEAVQSLGIVYSNPPSSWDLQDSPNQQGQRVRRSAQSVAEKIGTCLDTTILMASLLAAVDLYPIIFLGVHPARGGHAFVGYWRDENWRKHPGFWYLADGRNLVDAGIVVPIETTMVTDATTDYAEALAIGKEDIATFTDFSGVPLDLVPQFEAECAAIDIAVAHRSGTIPLPVRVAQLDGTVQMVEYKAQELTIDLLDRALQDQRLTSTGLQVNDAPRRVKRWMDSLLDLSLRNPLLNYRFSPASSVSLMIPDGFLGRLEDILQSGGKLGLMPNLLTDGTGRPVQLSGRHTLPEGGREVATQALVGKQELLTNVTPDAFLTRMRRMLNNAKSIVDETGSNQLYLAMGMVAWVPDGKAVECSAPLILLPVNIAPSNRSREFALAVDTTSQVTPNFSLAEKLRVDAKLDLPKLVAPDLDDAGIDVDGLIKYVRDEFIKAGLNDFRVDESCTLGFFDFSTYRLWKDLKDNWGRFEQNSALVKHLVESPTQPFADPVEVDPDVNIDDFAAALPVLADGSQARAVHDAMQGKTFVLQGPPGTGKSQTITNLLARALHGGKRVLFVAEKPDALAVVRDRLVKVGLGTFGLNLHDKGMKPADVRQQISDALNVNAIPDKTGFDAASRDIGRTIAPLQKYPERLHRAGSLGESAYSARDKLLALTTDYSLPVPATFIATTNLETVDHVRTIVRDVRDAVSNAGSARDNPWSLATIGTAGFGADQRETYLRLVNAVPQAIAAIQANPAAVQYLSSVESLPELIATAPLAQRTIDLTVVDASAGDAVAQARKHVVENIGGWAVDRLFAGAGPRIVEAPVTELRASAEAAIKSFFIGRKKKVLAAAERVQGYLAPGAVVSGDQLLPIIGEVEKVQTGAKQYLDYIRSIPGLFVAPSANLLVPEDRAAILEQVQRIDGDVALAASDGSPARTRVRALIAGGRDAAQAVGVLGGVLGEILRLVGANQDSFLLWLAGRRFTDVLLSSAGRWAQDGTETDFRALRRWLALRELLAQLEAAGLTEASKAIAAGTVPAQDVDLAFERGFLAGVLRKQIDDEGLDAFDGNQHDALVRGYTTAADSLRRLSPGILAHDMIGSRGFDAGVTVGAVGELKRELGKQRQFKPIRRLLKEHWQVISRATPLVLAIPDALVRFLDGDLEPFDLVVFDEASQIRTAHAIGVLGRGRAAIVVGDDKQMPPTSIAQISSGTDEGDDVDEDEGEAESILSECVTARVPEVKLTWHYRSEDESLIAFSNHEYYKSELSTLPSPSPKAGGKGLHFVKIDDGRFIRAGQQGAGTNPKEAEAIVKEIVRRVHDPADSKWSIGVVTFNRPQQRLVQDMLRATEDAEVLAAIEREDEAIKVWNLETVQGSERDVMLFSVAFSKQPTRGGGEAVPLNFGPLNNSGGQRRLNVAVTRARRQTIVYCSFEPEELKVEGSSSEGLHHLQRYLRIARRGFEADGELGSRRPTAPDRHRDEIVGVLRERGLKAQANVGLSEFKVDIAVARNTAEGEWSLGILTDGPVWTSRKTVGDRDSLPLSLLADRMGWPAVMRVWTPDWLRNAKDIADQIEQTVADVESGQRKPVETVAAPIAPAQPQVIITESARAAGAQQTGQVKAVPSFPDVPSWNAWSPKEYGPEYVLEQLQDARTQEYLRNVVRDVIRVEGPVLSDRAAKHLGRMHGLERVREARVSALKDVLKQAFVTSNDGFFFSQDEGPETYRKWSKVDGTPRTAEEISLVELSNAMHDIAKVGLGASRDELISSTALAFGWSRVGAGIRERLEKAMDEGIRRGVLKEENGYLNAV